MVLISAAPLAFADTHHVVKGAQGPWASAVTWSYTPTDYGMWYGHIVNNGLRSLIVDVSDNSMGVPEEISHQRIHFAANDAFPSGVVDSRGVIMAAGHQYVITVTPNGPKDSYCDVEDMYIVPAYPVADFSATVSSTTVSLNAGASYDPDGTITSYAWAFGDGQVGTGVTIVHTYAIVGTYAITLTVTDNDGLSTLVTKTVVLVDNPPVALFTVTSSGFTVSVDATGSSDDWGIASYAWNWGDGTSGTGVTATHTYSGAPPVLASTGMNTVRQPIPPYNVQGVTIDPVGNPVGNCDVTITNTRTGESVFTTSDPVYGWYEYDLNQLSLGWAGGDVISVTATALGWSGTNTGVAVSGGPYLDVNVVVLPSEVTYTITLTVTDALGQTATMSTAVTLSPA